MAEKKTAHKAGKAKARGKAPGGKAPGGKAAAHKAPTRRAAADKPYRASARRGTHMTKNRALVSGSGRKPWRQKGTGRARVGDIRTPLWRHGGTVFGPTPRDYSYSMPKKARAAA